MCQELDRETAALFAIQPRMKELLEAELQPGEKLVWCQQPGSLAFVRESLVMFFFGIPFFSLPAVMLYNLAYLQWHESSWSVLLLLLSFVGFFAAIGLVMMLSPAWAWWTAVRTVYAITNRRGIAIEAPRRCKVQSHLVGAESADIIDLYRIEDKRGRGDLVFHRRAVSGKRGVRYYDVGFKGVQNVREVERLVRELMAGKREG
jgi:hypothetical protein